MGTVGVEEADIPPAHSINESAFYLRCELVELEQIRPARGGGGFQRRIAVHDGNRTIWIVLLSDDHAELLLHNAGERKS